MPTPPSGYGIYVATFTLTGSTKIFNVSTGFRIIGLDTAATSRSKIEAAFSGSTAPFAPGAMAVGYSWVQSYVLQNLSGLLTTSLATFLVAGTKAISPTTPNTSLVVAKTTALAGRQYRGRFLVPPFNLAEGDVSAAGKVGGTSLSDNTARWHQAWLNMNGSGAPAAVLLHGPDKLGVTPPPTNTTDFLPSTTIGTIRRRIRP